MSALDDEKDFQPEVDGEGQDETPDEIPRGRRAAVRRSAATRGS